MSIAFYPVKIKNIEALTPLSKKFVLEIPLEQRSLFKDWIAGQNVSVRVYLEDQKISRPYSIVDFDGEHLFLVVKQVQNGVASHHIHNNFQVDQTIEITAPKGKYLYTPEDHENLILFATGSGITPIYAMISKALAKNPNQNIRLFYGNSDPNETIFYSELKNLAEKYSNFKVYFFFSQVEKKQRISPASVKNLSESLLFQGTKYYLCGVPAMMENIRSFLIENNVKAEQIFQESFIKIANPVSTSKPENLEQNNIEKKSKVEVIIDKIKTNFELEYELNTFPEEKNILQTANALGADLPYSCLEGICCTCRAKLIEGKVEMKNNLALDVEEEKQGYILCCQSYPRSEKVVISFDL